jgi:hypothetical protein
LLPDSGYDRDAFLRGLLDQTELSQEARSVIQELSVARESFGNGIVPTSTVTALMGLYLSTVIFLTPVDLRFDSPSCLQRAM